MTYGDRRPLITAAVLLGIGMGGFVDGIVFHQLLQVHNMLSHVRPPTNLVDIEVNMFWDGLFHVMTWLTTAGGLVLLWRAVLRGQVVPSTRTFVGSLFLGWGLFNFVEGVINHHILGIHHVVEPGVLIWDLAFLASGLVFMAGGWMAIRSESAETTSRASRAGLSAG